MGLIALAAAGSVDEEGATCAAACLQSALGVQTRRLDAFPELANAYDPARKQYSSTLVLRDALARRPSDAYKLLVLTERDLFIPMLSFVYGQAQLSGPIAVLSFARLRQEFYGLPANRPLFFIRIGKETLHEIGHTMGLTHCTDRSCTMSLSTNIQQLDEKGTDYCESCAALLREASGPALNVAVLARRSGGHK
ncbi:MAG TPA: archaemetzincin family Zn-dependent metalloprotease [Thermoanaerobaculia bacterium]|nr:archaemetzincin family Zn-dependent metalloprotease [Thermoanaerobaculia bacterium]